MDTLALWARMSRGLSGFSTILGTTSLSFALSPATTFESSLLTGVPSGRMKLLSALIRFSFSSCSAIILEMAFCFAMYDGSMASYTPFSPLGSSRPFLMAAFRRSLSTPTLDMNFSRALKSPSESWIESMPLPSASRTSMSDKSVISRVLSPGFKSLLAMALNFGLLVAFT